MPDIALLTSTAPAAGTTPSDAAPTTIVQSKKEPLEVDTDAVRAAQEHRRGPELCRIMQEWFDREASAQAARQVMEEAKKRAFEEAKKRAVEEGKKQAIDQLWLPRFGSLLDFPGAVGLDTPFFLFLQHLHFPPDQFSTSIAHSSPPHTVKNPLLAALYGPSGPFGPFRTLYMPDLNIKRKEWVLALLRNQLEPEFVDMPLRAVLDDKDIANSMQFLLVNLRKISVTDFGGDYPCRLVTTVWEICSLLRLVCKADAPDLLVAGPYGRWPLSIFGAVPRFLLKGLPAGQSDDKPAVRDAKGFEEQESDKPSDEAVLANAARPYLDSLNGDKSKVLFCEGKVCFLTEYLPLFVTGQSVAPSGARKTLPSQTYTAITRNLTSFPSSLHPDFLAVPLARTGCASYVHVIGEPLDLHSSDLFWSLLAFFYKNPSSLSPSLQQIEQSPDGEDLLSALATEGLSFEPPAPPAPTASTEAKEESPGCALDLVSPAGKTVTIDKGRETECIPREETIETVKQKPSEEQADSLSFPSPSTELAIHLNNSAIPHHLLSPLNPGSPSSPLSDPALVLTVDSKILGNTHKATVFSASTSNGIKLVVKYSKEDKLIHEAKVLQHLNRLEPDLTPKCYGIFDGEGAMKGYRALLLEHGNETVTTAFGNLEEEQRQAIFDCLRTAHKAGYTQGSFAERNVVRDASGRYRLIDFKRAKSHECQAMKVGDPCDELEEARWALELFKKGV